MSRTLLRLGLWIVLICLALYVVRETFIDSPNTEFISQDTLKKIGGLGILVILLGAVAVIFEKLVANRMKVGVRRSHCLVCKVAIAKGEFYCRKHLRSIVEEEDMHERTLRRKPMA